MRQRNLTPAPPPLQGKVDKTVAPTLRGAFDTANGPSGSQLKEPLPPTVTHEVGKTAGTLKLDECRGKLKGESHNIDHKSVNAPKLLGVPMKWLSLVALTFATTWQTFILKFAREYGRADGSLYLNSSVVVFAEITKTLLSFLLVACEHKSLTGAWSALWGSSGWEAVKVSVPALAYVIMNNLLFFSLDSLSAAVQQVTYQLKILAAALLSVLMLGKDISVTKWCSLVFLVIGVAMVQYPRSAEQEEKSPLNKNDPVIGFCAVLLACLVSGFAGVYMEKMLKGSGAGIWLRNVQLGFFGTLTALMGAIMQDGEKIKQGSFLQGHSRWSVLAILTVACGGLLVAVVLKYADNILRQFSTALSITITSVVSWGILKDYVPDTLFAVGTFVTISATFVYNLGFPVDLFLWPSRSTLMGLACCTGQRTMPSERK